jgi:23S rRNA-/tRNA-specific pseudouridylate synthase
MKPITGLDRLALHARSLIIQHPATHEVIPFTADYPEDFDSFLTRNAVPH